jgi:tRNA threonylcarbamoyladenosine biosynthesis protein TsaE
MEVYNLLNCLVYHFDLYRLSSPVELLEYGLLEPLVANADVGVVCLVEWPEQAQGVLPEPDLQVQLAFVPAVPAVQALGTENQEHSLALPCMQERALVLQSFGARGQAVLAGCQAWSQANL